MRRPTLAEAWFYGGLAALALLAVFWLASCCTTFHPATEPILPPPWVCEEP